MSRSQDTPWGDSGGIRPRPCGPGCCAASSRAFSETVECNVNPESTNPDPGKVSGVKIRAPLDASRASPKIQRRISSPARLPPPLVQFSSTIRAASVGAATPWRTSPHRHATAQTAPCWTRDTPHAVWAARACAAGPTTPRPRFRTYAAPTAYAKRRSRRTSSGESRAPTAPGRPPSV
jgi:hypothetical protein